jgi:hypothetical protein
MSSKGLSTPGCRSTTRRGRTKVGGGYGKTPMHTFQETLQVAKGKSPAHDFHSWPGMIRRMNSSNSGTVNAVSP